MKSPAGCGGLESIAKRGGLGFNSRVHKRAPRLLSRDGTFNVASRGHIGRRSLDLYHRLLRVRPSRFLGLLGLGFLGVNLVFTLAYVACGSESLEGAGASGHSLFFDAFFFSVQTVSTIGYGKITPVGLAANLVVTVEAFTGLLGMALATGLLFARFSRPTARVVFSDKALITSHDGIPSLMFRLSNVRLNQIMDAQISVVFTLVEKTQEGETYRTYNDLELERGRTPMLALSWTIVHPITASSPMHGHTRESLREHEAEILAVVSGTDDTFAQTIHARASYNTDDLVWDRQFADIMTRENGRVTIDLSRLHELKPDPGVRLID